MTKDKKTCTGIPPYHIYMHEVLDNHNWAIHDDLCDICKKSISLWHNHPCDWWMVMRAGCKMYGCNCVQRDCEVTTCQNPNKGKFVSLRAACVPQLSCKCGLPKRKEGIGFTCMRTDCDANIALNYV